jgi:transposase
LLRYCDDGLLEIDNNAAERALRAVAVGSSLCTSFSSA